MVRKAVVKRFWHRSRDTLFDSHCQLIEFMALVLPESLRPLAIPLLACLSVHRNLP